ncbi:hypothetical protein H4R18_001819 [Coemansia javaensis]|uniref:Small ribosomal subunit protein bS18m n=1 Tax=Coemansia javaensis TaxID=2761396 RepID=A0A9W8HDT2_9FUNG|nr:hypothetical protein H4R18_001819 [Coemansia javaensis]
MDQIMAPMAKQAHSKALESAQYTRKFAPLESYHPEELNEANARRQIDVFSRGQMPADPFKVLGIDPLKEYKNSMLLSQYITEMGKIKPRYKSGLSAKSQRRVAKAIRRARSFGLIPVTTRFEIQANHRSLTRGSSSM